MKKMFWSVVILLGLNGYVDKAAAEEAEPAGKKVNTYYYAPIMSASAVTSKLEAAGFEIVATYLPTQKSETVIITNKELKAAAGKPGRGFAAVIRVLIDQENRRIAVTNPVYFGKAYLQSDYDHVLALKTTEALKRALGDMTASPDAFDYDKLAGYHFMVAMPYYEDTYDLAKGETTDLISKFEGFDGGKHVVFKLELGEGRTLFGFDLSDDTKNFVNKIGVQNAEILPYTVLVEDGKAKALAAKYYIAISYPLLTMGEFMTIVTVPGAIEKELKQAFR